MIPIPLFSAFLQRATSYLKVGSDHDYSLEDPREMAEGLPSPLLKERALEAKVVGAVTSLASQVSIVDGVGTMLNKKEELSFA